MKYTILLVALISLCACTKKYCWRCETSRTLYVGATVLQRDTFQTPYCDRSEEDIKSEEGTKRDDKSYVGPSGPGVYISNTDCEKN